jgi:hypothetical protein
VVTLIIRELTVVVKRKSHKTEAFLRFLPQKRLKPPISALNGTKCLTRGVSLDSPAGASLWPRTARQEGCEAES